jgi:hypothetical protein
MALKYNIKLISLLFLIMIILIGCNNSEVIEENNELNDNEIKEKIINVEKIEVIHFHATNQCYSCITVGEYAKDTIETYFSDELKQGIIEFKHINGELAENKEIVLKFGAKGSSLFIGTYEKDGKLNIEENINVWYKIRNKQDYMDYLSDVIKKRLSGDYS